MSKHIFIGLIVMALSAPSFALSFSGDNYNKEYHEITAYGGTVDYLEQANSYDVEVTKQPNRVSFSNGRSGGVIKTFIKNILSFNFFPFNLFR